MIVTVSLFSSAIQNRFYLILNTGDPIFYPQTTIPRCQNYPHAGIGSVFPGINAYVSKSQGNTRKNSNSLRSRAKQQTRAFFPARWTTQATSTPSWTATIIMIVTVSLFSSAIRNRFYLILNTGDPIFYTQTTIPRCQNYPHAGIGSVFPGINAYVSKSQGKTRKNSNSSSSRVRQKTRTFSSAR